MGRLQVVVVLAIALGAGLTSAQNVDYFEQHRTKCWDCHSDDRTNVPEPLRSVWRIQAPQELPVSNSATALEIAVQNSWYADVTYLEPTLDLSAAPSLAFFDDREPFTDAPIGTITRPTPNAEVNPPALTPEVSGVNEPARGHVNTTIPNGATSLLLSMQTIDARFSPETQWFIHPGRGVPGDDPIGPLQASGGPATFHIETPSGFQGLGYGLWAIEARVPPVTDDGAPNPFGTDLAFRVDVEARFDATEARTSTLSSQATLEPFQTELFAWSLIRVGIPGADESISLNVNGTVFFEHKATSNALDEEHITIPFTLAVQEEGGNPVIRPSADLLIVIAPNLSAGASLVTISEAIGYASAFLIMASIYTGGMFGKATRRQLNQVFGSAKRRVAFHNFLSYGLTLAAVVHTFLFIYAALTSGASSWTLGIIWGGLAILAMFGLGVTGALQVPMIRRWNYGVWRWSHFWLAIAAITFTIVHMLLDGVHFGAVQEWVGWSNPLDFRPEAQT